MARSRFENLELTKQEAILAAAAEEFAERGYESASLNRIIDDAGISKGSLYYYFEDKEDLFATTWRRAVERLLADAGPFEPEKLESDTYWDEFREWVRRSMEALHANEWYVKMGQAFARIRMDATASEALKDVVDWGRNLTRSILARGQALGVVRTDLPLDLLVELLMAMDAAGDRWYMEHWGEYTREELNRLADAEMDMMRAMLDASREGWER
ncbi:MAG TPA: helix-turn-helix domain-containing protein [Longimicrobiales bacterium]|nr:helix-turn-helix domain-containing protein [Longimicrobiales bacterium]